MDSVHMYWTIHFVNSFISRTYKLGNLLSADDLTFLPNILPLYLYLPYNDENTHVNKQITSEQVFLNIVKSSVGCQCEAQLVCAQ